MLLLPNRFYIGDVGSFLGMVKLLKTDSEFCICFDFEAQCLEMESMMMAGVVAIGIRLFQGTGSILVPSPRTRQDRVTLRVNSASFYQAVGSINQVAYAYMSLGLNEEETALCLCTYDQEHVRLGSAVVHTLHLEEHDMEFTITREDRRETLVYDILIDNLGSTWKSYLQVSTLDTVIHYVPKEQTITWENTNDQTKVSLYLPVSSPCTLEVRVCLYPPVVSILRMVLQVATKQKTTLSLGGEDLPVRLFAPLDGEGSFIRAYAGTKDDL